ncbi:MAG: SWIM zinc finger family protein [Gemmatales bacterium]
MSLSTEQVLKLAPDEASVAAARKLQSARHWYSLGCSENAWWGECQGSTLYQVKVERSNGGYHCNCPSRKFPCKHVLGLLLVVAQEEAAVPVRDQPSWVSEWLGKRQAAAARKEAKAAQPDKPVDEQAQARRAALREKRVREGLQQLDRWLCDLMRTGLAGLEARGVAPWEEQARRLVDAQASGLATRLRKLSEIPGSTPDWPLLLLYELGKLKLLLRAFDRLEQLPSPLVADVRQAIGWSVPVEELTQHGDKVDDEWQILGQWTEEEDRLRVQRTWCRGKESQRVALVLQFAVGSTGFAQAFTPGTQQKGCMLFYPGAVPQRAHFVRSQDAPQPLATLASGYADFSSFLQHVAQQLGAQPWLNTFPAILQEVSLCRQDDHWQLHDRHGRVLPVKQADLWQYFAHTGGQPVDLAGEWAGQRLRPLGYIWEGGYRVIS